MISAPSEMRCRVMPEYSMKTKTMASTSGMAIATTSAGAQAEADEAHRQHDDHGLEQRAREVADRLLDDRRLVRHEMDADADRQLAHDLPHARLQRPRRTARMSPLGFMPMARPIAGWPLKRNIGCGGST